MVVVVILVGWKGVYGDDDGEVKRYVWRLRYGTEVREVAVLKWRGVLVELT